VGHGKAMFRLEEILEATGGRLLNRAKADGSYCVSIDTRTIQAGEVFIAIKGDRLDGHDFIQEAFTKGAAGCIINKLTAYSLQLTAESFIIIAPNTTRALADLAIYHRQRFDIPVVAITGSNGKTTTKDLTALCLSPRFNILKTKGTLNNIFGVSLTLLRLLPEHEYCVLELGTNAPGEIKQLVEIARPNIGIITNIGPSHLEFLKDLHSVYKEKSALFANFKKDGLAIWNGDDPMLADLFQMTGPRRVTFGMRPECDYQADRIRRRQMGLEFFLNTKVKIRLNTIGTHNVYNCLAAIAAAKEAGVELPDIAKALQTFRPPWLRMQILEARGVLIIKDCYNSNPKSMESAISSLSKFVEKRKILISGDMLELGEAKEYFHHQIGKQTAESPIDLFVGVGELSKEAVQAAIRYGMPSDCVWHCADSTEAGRLLLKIIRPEDVVLIKGSRGIQMEKAIECFTTSSTH